MVAILVVYALAVVATEAPAAQSAAEAGTKAAVFINSLRFIWFPHLKNNL